MREKENERRDINIKTNKQNKKTGKKGGFKRYLDENKDILNLVMNFFHMHFSPFYASLASYEVFFFFFFF